MNIRGPPSPVSAEEVEAITVVGHAARRLCCAGTRTNRWGCRRIVSNSTYLRFTTAQKSPRRGHFVGAVAASLAAARRLYLRWAPGGASMRFRSHVVLLLVLKPLSMSFAAELGTSCDAAAGSEELPIPRGVAVASSSSSQEGGGDSRREQRTDASPRVEGEEIACELLFAPG